MLGLVLRVKEKRDISKERRCHFREVHRRYLVGLQRLLKLQSSLMSLYGFAQGEGTAYNIRVRLKRTKKGQVIALMASTADLKFALHLRGGDEYK